ncbi:hypothetical protein L3V77_20300 [Vibrio sp. DW001]|uniref:hypothetical protein n=1 Tax=Vibrio sp. DW001 TaxID=2912315 RepID=UPI0023AEC0A7|nr:hypothetical protein [Vibrio sp. DW001]WED29754.1 hypothetical protein L3V77_20300 [Vibrio sp. DW001]
MFIKDKFGEIDNDWCIPCACQFDKNRNREAKYLPYNGYLWECTKFDNNGFCLSTERNSVIGSDGFIDEECALYAPTKEQIANEMERERLVALDADSAFAELSVKELKEQLEYLNKSKEEYKGKGDTSQVLLSEYLINVYENRLGELKRLELQP